MSLVPVDTMSALAVTDYLTRARDWLAQAVETTGPEQIAAAKAEIATAAEATKQLGLSKEIREDAAEMVRRAEYALRKSLNRAQVEGFVRSRESNLIPGGPNAGKSEPCPSSLPRPADFFSGRAEHLDASEMARLSPEEFDDVIDEAKAEGNLSRANVARKAREKSGRPAPTSRERSIQESELITAFRSMVRPLLSAKNVETLSPKSRALLVDLLDRAIQTLKGTDQ